VIVISWKGEDITDRTSNAASEPANLRWLRRLVTTLTAVLILGVIAIVALLVIRLNAAGPGLSPALPAEIALPAGETATALTRGTGWIAVVTRDDAGAERIRVLDAATLAELSVTEVAR
jgi:hypothetical protein